MLQSVTDALTALRSAVAVLKPWKNSRAQVDAVLAAVDQVESAVNAYGAEVDARIAGLLAEVSDALEAIKARDEALAAAQAEIKRLQDLLDAQPEPTPEPEPEPQPEPEPTPEPLPGMPLSSIEDEERFYAALGWDFSSARRLKLLRTVYTPSRIDVHNDSENDPLLDFERMILRGAPSWVESVADAWSGYFVNHYLNDVASQSGTTNNQEISGCHTYGAGLALRFRRTADPVCKAALEAIGTLIEGRYAEDEGWQVGWSGHRAVGRQLRVVAELVGITPAERWRTLAERIVSRLLSTPYWDERGFFHVGEWATETILKNTTAWPQAKVFSTLERAALVDGLIGYTEMGGPQAAEVKRRLLRMAEWSRDHALTSADHPYSASWKYVDWPAVGEITDNYSSGYVSTPYTGTHVPLLTWAYAQTGQRAFLDVAVEAYLREITAVTGDAVKSKANYDAKRIHRMMNSAFYSDTMFLGDPQHGDLFYLGALPRVYLQAIGQQEPIPEPEPSEPIMTTIDSFTVSPPEVVAGEPVTVSWQTTDAAEVRLNGEVVPLDGQIEDVPTGDKTYLLEAFPAPQPPVSQSLGVVVNDPPPPPPPPTGDSPLWASALEENRLYKIPNSSFISAAVKAQYTVPHVDVPLSQGGAYVTGAANNPDTIHYHNTSPGRLYAKFAFSGCAYDHVNDELWVHGGGGGSGANGNDILRFRANREVPDWVVECQPSPASAYALCDEGIHVDPVNGPWYYDRTTFKAVRVLRDGRPGIGHMASRVQFLPSINSMMKFFGGVTIFEAGGGGDMWRYDAATKKWIGGAPIYPSWFSQMTDQFGKPVNMASTSWNASVVDPRDDTVYFISHVTGRIYRWRGIADPFRADDCGSLPYVFNTYRYYMWPALIDTIRNRLVVATGGIDSLQGPLRLATMDLADTANKQVLTPTWNAPEKTFPNQCAMTHDTRNDQYILWRALKSTASGDWNNIYKINPDSPHDVELIQFHPLSDPLPNQTWMPLTRFRYSPRLRGVLIPSSGTNETGCSVYLLKLEQH